MVIKVAVPHQFKLKVIPDLKTLFFVDRKDIHYIGGSDILPAPLEAAAEKKAIKDLGTEKDENARKILIEHNLRLVVYIAKKFDNTGVGVEDLISIGTIGLIKAINTFNPSKKIKLATYASRCIENEVLMVMRSSKKLQNEISIDESIGTDREGNNMTFSDILTCDSTDIADLISGKLEAQKLYNAMKKILAPTEINILCWRYGLGNQPKKTQKEIADILGISRSYVSRIEKKCLERLLDELKE